AMRRFEARTAPIGARLAWAMRTSARTSSAFVIECQRSMPFRLAIDAKFFRDRDLRASKVMQTLRPFSTGTYWPGFRGKVVVVRDLCGQFSGLRTPTQLSNDDVANV